MILLTSGQDFVGLVLLHTERSGRYNTRTRPAAGQPLAYGNVLPFKEDLQLAGVRVGVEEGYS